MIQFNRKMQIEFNKKTCIFKFLTSSRPLYITVTKFIDAGPSHISTLFKCLSDLVPIGWDKEHFLLCMQHLFQISHTATFMFHLRNYIVSLCNSTDFYGIFNEDLMQQFIEAARCIQRFNQTSQSCCTQWIVAIIRVNGLRVVWTGYQLQ